MSAALFFTWSFTSALLTVNALRRPVPPGVSLPPLWLPGMIVSELAPWLLVATPVVTWVFISFGALTHWLGVVGLTLLAAAAIGLVPLIARTVRSTRAAGGSVGAISLLNVYQRMPAGVEKTERVHYWNGLTLDAYRRPALTDAPALIYIHAGSWMRGRPGRTAKPLLYTLADRGWVVLDIRYPLSPTATFPEHLIGVKRAIAWAKSGGGAELGVDRDRVAIAGGSSGAHLAALAALTWDHPDLQPGFETADTSVLACTPHYGIYDLLIRNATRYDWPFIAKKVLKADRDIAPELYRLGSPIDQARADSPPFFVVHGDFDSVVLADESRQFVTAMEGVGSNVEYHEVHGAQHGFDAVGSVRSRAVGHLVADFLDGVAGRTYRENESGPRDGYPGST